MRRSWWIVGVVLGLALAAAAFLASQAGLDATAATFGLDRLSPLARPPLGQTARVALAALGFAVAMALAFLLRLVSPRDRDNAEEEGSDMPDLRRASMGEPTVAPTPLHREPHIVAEPPAEPFAAGLAGAPVEVALAEGAAIAHSPMVEPVAAEDEPLPSRGRSVDDALLARLDRIEAALAEPRGQMFDPQVGPRLDALDARLGQIAQQIAELAGVARVAARSPAPPPLQTPIPRPLESPTRLRSIAEAARALRARLDDASA